MNHFFAYVSRLRLIRRWALMRNTQPENDAEHSMQVAMIAHGIAVIAAKRYQREVDPEHVLALGLYHDATEVLTGDMPTPVKYQSDTLRGAYRRVERQAAEKLAHMLPEDLQGEFAPYLTDGQDYEHRLVKAADSICAYLKCVEELRAGNHEFDAAGETIRRGIESIDLPEVQDFMREFAPSFSLTLDELNRPEEGI